VEPRNLFVVSDQTENVEGGELHAFKDDPVEPIDGVFEDGTEGSGVRMIAEDTVERDLDDESVENARFTTIVE
jgi:hypothetical protein